jgi:hypothetical protein
VPGLGRDDAEVDERGRRAVVAALIDLAGSSDYRDRADAGRCLASFLDVPEAGDAARQLVLDAEDTYVTVVAAEALLRRKDTPGLAVLAAALPLADDNHLDWIYPAIRDVFGVLAHERDAAVEVCQALSTHPDQQVRAGAAQLTAELRQLEPILRRAEDSPQPPGQPTG